MSTIEFVDLRAAHDSIRGELDDVWATTLSRSGFIGGPCVDEFERDWAAACGARAAVGVGNGTDALELALHAAGVRPGDEVIVPTNTFVATASAVVAVGAHPVFVDVDPADLLLSTDHVAAAIGPRTTAIVAVHLFGQMAPMREILDIARRHSLSVVEDAAQAHLASRDGRAAGSWGTTAAFSFYPGKNLGALGDGGAVVVGDDDIAERVRSIANHGRSAQSRHVHLLSGRNSRLDGLQAAVLSVKLRRLREWNDRRRLVASWYEQALADLPVTRLRRGAEDDVFHLYVVRTPRRDELLAHLGANAIGAGVHYPVPCHLQPAFSTDRPPSLPVAEQAAGEIISLPIHPHITESDVERVAWCVAGFFRARHVA
ncbi:MAG: DegT/DnrJ/EryC1/StrS family aminotransferase [Ilumatobacteraceae bacterium]